MPNIPVELVEHAPRDASSWHGFSHIAEVFSRKLDDSWHELFARVNVSWNGTQTVVPHAGVSLPANPSSSPPAGLVYAQTHDPFLKSGKYALGWVYFAIIVLFFAILLRIWNLFTDRIRTAIHQEEVHKSITSSPDTDYELANMYTDRSTNKLFPRVQEHQAKSPQLQPTISSIAPINNSIAFFRYVFYRPLPEIRFRKKWRPIVLPSLAVSCLVIAAVAFVTLYCFLPEPLYYWNIQFGSPPLAIRAGMIAVALMPWIIATSMKANVVSMLTGIGHERLNVLHRWMAYISLFLSCVHTVPFYIGSARDPKAFAIYKSYFQLAHFYLYGSGIACLALLGFLCVHSLSIFRRAMYELFVTLHVPISIAYLGLLFWHCKNYLTSWAYLEATVVIWVVSYLLRFAFYLNWTRPTRLSWLIGDECAVTPMPENALKVTVPTQVRWKPGQFAYLRMPGISAFENHPFTIASLCSEDFPSEYGEEYRDMVFVFRPFGGFTKRVLESSIEKGPWHTYRAFIDGPYGGMRRHLHSFDNVVMIAGGSGITAIVSHMLDLIKRMRDGKAVTRNITVIWALKRPETMEWFKEELRICREFAPPDSVQCQFFITTAKRQPRTGAVMSAQTPNRPVSEFFHEKMNEAFQGIAEKRLSHMSNKRHSALIADEANGDIEIERQLRMENEDSITALPEAHVVPARNFSQKGRPYKPTGFGAHRGLLHDDEEQQHGFSNQNLHVPGQQMPSEVGPGGMSMRQSNADKRRNLSVDVAAAIQAGHGAIDPALATPGGVHAAPGLIPPQTGAFDFGFPSTPTEFQKNLMRFAFLPAAVKKRDGWSTEYGRPQLEFMLREMSHEWGRRTCVFVCGPPSMRIAVSKEVARLQKSVWQRSDRDEIYLHAENYAI